ncbi:MAG TPA: hypothetical protein DDW65_10595, partial [Firmicutes bacterium]|nr:hypothetical protein [Bacillota bacterium]
MDMKDMPETFPYIIQPGDTIRDLAELYDAKVATIFEINPGIETDQLVIGQVISMPGPPPSARKPGFDNRRRAKLERRRRAELERRRRAEQDRKRREELERR